METLSSANEEQLIGPRDISALRREMVESRREFAKFKRSLQAVTGRARSLPRKATKEARKERTKETDLCRSWTTRKALARKWKKSKGKKNPSLLPLPRPSLLLNCLRRGPRDSTVSTLDKRKEGGGFCFRFDKKARLQVGLHGVSTVAHVAHKPHVAYSTCTCKEERNRTSSNADVTPVTFPQNYVTPLVPLCRILLLTAEKDCSAHILEALSITQQT